MTRHAWWGWVIALFSGLWSVLWTLSLLTLLRDLWAGNPISLSSDKPTIRAEDARPIQRGAAVSRSPCPCCGYRTLDEEPPGTFEICPVCYWEDDLVQFRDPDYRGGANEESLNEARRNFKAFGASEERVKDRVRAPLPDELP